MSINERKTVWVINEDSMHFNWMVVSSTPDGALKTFKKMWLDWCVSSGADTDYWGGWEGIRAREVKLGVPYMDGEPFKCG